MLRPRYKGLLFDFLHSMRGFLVACSLLDAMIFGEGLYNAGFLSDVPHNTTCKDLLWYAP